MSKTLRFPPSVSVTPPPEHSDKMARMVADMTTEILAAEERIKDLILEAIDRGEYARATEIAQRWKVEMPTDLLRSLEKQCG